MRLTLWAPLVALTAALAAWVAFTVVVRTGRVMRGTSPIGRVQHIVAGPEFAEAFYEIAWHFPAHPTYREPPPGPARDGYRRALIDTSGLALYTEHASCGASYEFTPETFPIEDMPCDCVRGGAQCWVVKWR